MDDFTFFFSCLFASSVWCQTTCWEMNWSCGLGQCPGSNGGSSCFIGIPPRAHSRESSDSADGRATPSENLVPSSARVDKPPSVLPYFNRPPSALPLMGLPPPPMPPPPPLSSSFGVPPPPPGIHYQHLMPPPPRLPPHLAVPPPGAIPPALHLNPAFFPPPNATVGPPPDTYMKASAPYNHHGR